MKLYTTRHLVITGVLTFLVSLSMILFFLPRERQRAMNYEDLVLGVYDTAALAVVRVFAATDERTGTGNNGMPLQSVPAGGSGVLIDSEGHIVTSLHVVEGLDTLRVSDTAGSVFEARVIATRESSDLALLRADLPESHPFRPVEIAASDALRVGQLAFVIGNPYALGRSLTSGVVSAVNRVIYVDEQTVFRNMIQTDAAVNPGSSGGGLFDSSGRLLGIVSVLYSTQGGSMGIAFAVPAGDVQALVDSSRALESVQ
ncbi:MAG: S1C family serine protease [Spirochaetaceae bacterium]